MKQFIRLVLAGLLVVACKTEIKNPDAKIEIEEGTAVEITDVAEKDVIKASEQKVVAKSETKSHPLVGYWVGYFENDEERPFMKSMYIDEGYMWNRENKINISIDKIQDSIVVGHSVVAGNDRPFKGIMKKESDKSYSFKLKEPGDHKYDGVFVFTINSGELIGKWEAYENINIKHRKYNLEKKTFTYGPSTMLEEAKEYVNWNKVLETKEEIEMEEDYFEEWITTEYATATALIYEVNASNTLLKKSEVENLKKGDLTIIRNTIYARHGYSFKNPTLRVFFDAQNWYIPVHTNIKEDFTDLEKKNIQLLLKYEKNASEYYDYFGRG